MGLLYSCDADDDSTIEDIYRPNLGKTETRDAATRIIEIRNREELPKTEGRTEKTGLGAFLDTTLGVTIAGTNRLQRSSKAVNSVAIEIANDRCVMLFQVFCTKKRSSDLLISVWWSIGGSNS